MVSVLPKLRHRLAQMNVPDVARLETIMGDERIKAKLQAVQISAATTPAAPVGTPGRKGDPRKRKQADLANTLRSMTPPTPWKDVADIVNEKLSAEDGTKHTAASIRSLHKFFYKTAKKNR